MNRDRTRTCGQSARHHLTLSARPAERYRGLTATLCELSPLGLRRSLAAISVAHAGDKEVPPIRWQDSNGSISLRCLREKFDEGQNLSAEAACSKISPKTGTVGGARV